MYYLTLCAAYLKAGGAGGGDKVGWCDGEGEDVGGMGGGGVGLEVLLGLIDEESVSRFISCGDRGRVTILKVVYLCGYM